MDQAEWEQIKKQGKPSDADYERRYQSLLNRYGIKGGGDTGGVIIDKASGAAQVEVTPKDEARAVKEDSKKAEVKESKAEAKPAVKKKKASSKKAVKQEVKKNIGGEASNKAHTPKDKLKVTVPKKEEDVKKSTSPLAMDNFKPIFPKGRKKIVSESKKKKPVTIASLRNEYQQELMKKHKKEMSGS